ncbi:sensor histidine kinase [Paenibacillus terrigena]|uniref:cache domain-containing sensor histidine kinase n=1 Tax=Paenibacillus terrigena TaxID=369333 RepID=UPI0028D5FB3A|nr:sensor histidine kinase [Paenibacillus terrigena]
MQDSGKTVRVLRLLWTTFQSKSIQFKLTVYFLILILFPLSTLGFLGDVIYSRSIERETNQHTIQIIEQINKNVEFYIHDMENMIDILSQDPNVLTFFQIKSNLENNRVDVETEVRRNLANFKHVHPEVAGIVIVNPNDLYISNEEYRISRDPLTNEFWYKQAIESKDQLQLISRPLGRNLTAGINNTADDVVSIIKAIKHPTREDVIGVISIDLKLDTIEKMIQGITLGKSGFVYITDRTGEIVYAPVNPVVNRVNPSWLEKKHSHAMVKTILNQKHQIIYHQSLYTQWKTVGVFSLSETLQEVTTIRYYSLIIGMVTLLLAFIVAFIFVSSIVSPMKSLKNLMKKAENGDLSVHFTHPYQDEIGQVGNSFNNMIGELRNLIELVYQEQQSKREAEIRILQAQIKPHFLYNTLDGIEWMAEEQGANEIAEMIGALSNLFRLGLSGGQEMLSVHDELEHVRSYLIIQKMRYENKLDYEIICDPGLEHYQVLKLTLQPLVENAIYHGIKARRGKGMIRIQAHIRANELCLTVSDDGVGMTEEKLKEVRDTLDRKSIESAATSFGGFGIHNVNQRIKMSFGDQYGLEFHSQVHVGVTVHIWHPLIRR